MALRDQPYLPLYVDDFLSDERLTLCSAESTGVYIRLLCIMHKSEHYGKILLKQKQKQKGSNIENFAAILTKQMPYEFHTVTKSLAELVDEKVLSVEGDMLIQKRMVKDNEISEIRSAAGKKGGKTGIKNFSKTKAHSPDLLKANAKAKYKANSVIVNENVNVNVNENYISVWENEKLSFKNSGDWIFKMCRQHDVALEWMDRAMDAFLMELELKEDYKDVKELKRHFVNWLNAKKEKYMPEQKRMVV